MTKLRIFYRKSDNQIVSLSGLEGTGEFPHSVEEELESLPSVKVITNYDMPTHKETSHLVGGKSENYAFIELTDETEINSFMASDSNSIVKGKLVIGEPRPIVEPEKPRDLAKEIDDLKSRLGKLEAAKVV